MPRSEILESCRIPDCDGLYVYGLYCGAWVCDTCEDHKDLHRCYCDWSRTGGSGRDELIEMGETIDPD